MQFKFGSWGVVKKKQLGEMSEIFGCDVVKLSLLSILIACTPIVCNKRSSTSFIIMQYR